MQRDHESELKHSAFLPFSWQSKSAPTGRDLHLTGPRYFVVFPKCDVNSRLHQSILSLVSTLCQGLTGIRDQGPELCNHLDQLHESLYARAIRTSQDGGVHCMNSHHVPVFE